MSDHWCGHFYHRSVCRGNICIWGAAFGTATDAFSSLNVCDGHDIFVSCLEVVGSGQFDLNHDFVLCSSQSSHWNLYADNSFHVVQDNIPQLGVCNSSLN